MQRSDDAHVSLALHELLTCQASTTAHCSPSGRQAMRSLCAGACLSAGPFRLTHPRPVKGARTRREGGVPPVATDSCRRSTCRGTCGHANSHMHPVTWTAIDDEGSESPRTQCRPETGLMMQQCERCAGQLVLHTASEQRHPEAQGARVMHEKGADRCPPTNAAAHACDA